MPSTLRLTLMFSLYLGKQCLHLGRGALKGAVAAQKGRQGSEAGTRELGTEEKSVSPMRSPRFAL